MLKTKFDKYLSIVDVGAANGFAIDEWNADIRLITFEPDPRSYIEQSQSLVFNVARFGNNVNKINKYLTICNHFSKIDLVEVVNELCNEKDIDLISS